MEADDMKLALQIPSVENAPVPGAFFVWAAETA
jgi:hypothetical protein